MAKKIFDLNGCEAGFSLVEVLVALTILAAAAVPLSGMFYEGVKSADASGKKAVALNLAQEKMEEIIALGLTNEDAGSFSGFPGYRYEVVITPDGRMCRLSVCVKYSVSGVQKEASLTTLMPRGWQPHW